ncbi:uncharacterized protein LOC144642185 [Oculina patagonica]
MLRLLFIRKTSITAFDGVWHHVCVSWENSFGELKFYKDGYLVEHVRNFKKKYKIKKRGTVVLGQEQDSVGGHFDVNQSFQGMLSNTNVWSYVLPGTQIKEMSKSCQLDEWNDGDVYRWSDFLNQGGARLVQPSPCKPVETDCRDALGMESHAITDVQISASSKRSRRFAGFLGRLRSRYQGGCWSARTSDATQWLQVDLGNAHTRVTAVATQGKNAHKEWVRKYKLQYSNDGKEFYYYRERGRAKDKKLAGNADQNTIVYHVLTPEVMARYFRFRPLTWRRRISMRVELYGCSDCHGALGMENRLISNEKISASSQCDTNHAASQGRLHFKGSKSKAGSWTAQTNDANQWLQVDLGSQQTRVTGVATQGSSNRDQWVIKYKLQYSNDGTIFEYYRQRGEEKEKEFAANYDQDTVVYHELIPPITARYIRFRPLTWEKGISMRTELYGCPVSKRQMLDSAVSKSRSNIPTKTSDPEGDWTYWNGHYYAYRGKSAANSWYLAEGICRKYGDTVHLTSIHSQQENDFIKSLSLDGEEQWIGLTDHNTRDNSFQWIDRSAYGNFTNWAMNEPNNATIDEDCGAMKPDGTWIDVACKKQRLHSDTPFDRRAFTCKASGNPVNDGPSPRVQKRVKEVHQPAVSVVDLKSGGQSTKVTFFTGLHHIAPNVKFDSTTEKVRYGALLKFGGYVDMTPEQLDPLNSQRRRRDATLAGPVLAADPYNDLSGVADLDGIVDKIEIPHYAAMSTMGSPAFSIEFWIRPRRMPVDATPMALFLKSSASSGLISLNLNLNGSLTFSAIPNKVGTPLTCTTDIGDDTKVRALAFNHIAVTGKVGTSLMVTVNAEITCQKATWQGMAVMPASEDGTLVFGVNELDSRQLKRFNGQISNIQLFSTARTKLQIDRSIQNANPTAIGSIGFWSLRQSDEINVVHYVISTSQTVSDLKVLDEFEPPLTGLPVEAVFRDQNIYIVRVTGESNVVAKQFELSLDKRTLVSVQDLELESNQKVLIHSSKAEKGCLAATRDEGRDRLILIECFAEDQTLGALRFKWNIFEIHEKGKLTATSQDRGRGSFLVTDIGSLDTRLSARIVKNHLFLTAGTTSNASTLFLDITLDSNGLPSISVDKLVAQPVGPEIADSGVPYYAYLYKQNKDSSRKFLRRIRPKNGQVSSSYIINAVDTDLNSLEANAISDNMPNNDWFWYLFKITALNGRIAIQSGDEINIQTPDNNPKNSKGWSFVNGNCESLQCDQLVGPLVNFWIFKTESCDPDGDGAFSVVSGEIGPNDCILLWPKTEQFQPGYYQLPFSLPTKKEIQSAKVRFGSLFGPWHLKIPMEPSPIRPIPVPDGSPSNSPTNVYEGNKYSLLHFGEGISLKTSSPRSGIRGGLLRFAKTTVTPVVVSNNENPALVKLIFRGNGGPIPLPAFPRDVKAKIEVLFSTVYKEGSYAQRRMTSGLFYSVQYIPPSDSMSPGEFKNLTRIGGLESLEYPNPPASFVWLIPPPFKVSGMCAAISTLFLFDDDTVINIAPNSVSYLTKVVSKAVGPGSFGEGLFKPFVSVHFNLTLLKNIGEQVHASLMRKINEHIPKPPPASPTARPPRGTHSWQELGDLHACVFLSNLTFWENKIQHQKLHDKLTQLLQSKWMTKQIYEIRQEVAPDLTIDIDSKKYSAYGGIAVLIATRLKSPDFLEQLLTHDKSYVLPILDSYLKVLDLLQPKLGIEVRQDLMSTLLAREILNQPWTILQCLDKDKQREAIKMAITTIYEGNVSEDDRKIFVNVMTEIMNDIVSPLTSTQLGIFRNFLDLKKLDVLKAVDARAKDFEVRFLDIFVQEHLQDVTEINQVRQAKPRILKTLDLIKNHRQYWLLNDKHAELWKEFLEMNKINIEKKVDRLASLFKSQQKESEVPLRKLPFLHRVLENNPRFATGMSHTFNLLGTVAAGYSIIKEISDPKSGFSTGNVEEVLSVIATAVGGIGSFKGTYNLIKASFKGTYDLMKVLKEKLFKPRRTAGTDVELQDFTDGVRTPDGELHVTVQEELATEVSVDLNNMERASKKLVRMMEPSVRLGTKVFTALGVVADGIFFGISVYDLYKDFKADGKDSWKIADDFAFAASAGIGAGLGLASIFEVEVPIVGPLLVLGAALGATISETIRGNRERERICNEWKPFCSWGENLLKHYEFLLDNDANYCAQCPWEKKRHMRDMCSDRKLLSSTFKRALPNGLGSGKDVKSLVPSLRRIKKKTCPSWLRHVHKSQGKRPRKLNRKRSTSEKTFTNPSK